MDPEFLFAVIVRMSTNSSMMIKLPFSIETVDPSKPQDQMDMGAWILGRHGGSWIPVVYGRGTESQMEEAQAEFAEEWSKR